jgi:[acyl-carrier-protein] S-malonyltransferase
MSNAALLFPGQGSHSPDMAEPYRGTPLFERGLELLGYDPVERLDEGTRTQQPALFLCSVAAWEAAGQPDALAAAGHSLGEYAALVVAGVLEFEDALLLVDRRAAAMADAAAATHGGMVAMLGGDSHAVAELARDVGLVVANDNAPGQLVLAGAIDAVDVAAERGQEAAGARVRRLDVSGAFHSPLMATAAHRLEAALAEISFHEPRFPVYSCASAAPFTDPRRELAQNLLRAVRWRETLIALRDAGAEEFVELGPGRILTGLAKRTVPEVARR